MTFFDLVKRRQSVRRYLPKPVETEKLHRCLETARLAPSASNSQPWSFVVVTDPETREKVASQTYDRMISFNRFVQSAPVLVVFVIEKPKLVTQIGSGIKKLNYPLIDIGIAAEHFCLQAEEEGLGSCMLGWFRARPIKEILGIPKSRTIGLIVSLGYPPPEYKVREKKRKKFDEVVFYNAYKKPGNA